jgi:predicted DNA-binding WGR domain protein
MEVRMKDDPWTNPPANFTYILFDLVNVEKNQNRFYRIGWQSTLVDASAVVVHYGRKGESQRSRVTPFDSLEAAWPTIKLAIRRRLKHGYRIIEPIAYRDYKPTVEPESKRRGAECLK